MNPLLARILLTLAIQILKRLKNHYESLSEQERAELREQIAALDPTFGKGTLEGP